MSLVPSAFYCVTESLVARARMWVPTTVSTYTYESRVLFHRPARPDNKKIADCSSMIALASIAFLAANCRRTQSSSLSSEAQ